MKIKQIDHNIDRFQPIQWKGFIWNDFLTAKEVFWVKINVLITCRVIPNKTLIDINKKKTNLLTTQEMLFKFLRALLLLVYFFYIK